MGFLQLTPEPVTPYIPKTNPTGPSTTLTSVGLPAKLDKIAVADDHKTVVSELIEQATEDLRSTIHQLQSELAMIKLKLRDTKAVLVRERRKHKGLATLEVLHNYDLMEDVLLYLPMWEVVRCERLNKFFHDMIHTSIRLRRHTWRTYQVHDQITPNPAVGLRNAYRANNHRIEYCRVNDLPVFFVPEFTNEPTFPFDVKGDTSAADSTQAKHSASWEHMYALRGSAHCTLRVYFPVPVCTGKGRGASRRGEPHHHEEKQDKVVEISVGGDIRFREMKQVAIAVAYSDLEYDTFARPLDCHDKNIFSYDQVATDAEQVAKVALRTQELELAIKESNRLEAELERDK